MPPKLGYASGALGAYGSMKNFMTVMRELSFDSEREQAERMPRMLILAPDATNGSRLGSILTGVDASAAVTCWELSAANRSMDFYDAVIVFDPNSDGVFRRVRDRMGRDERSKVFDIASIEGDPERWADPLRHRIVNALPDQAPAFGRWFPIFRPAATKSVIDETAKVNAQFALVTNIPAIIPIIGSIAAAGADFFILTKNQVMMVFKLAAIQGRDLTDQWQIVREMIPVVGAGFLWRTLAREAASFLPLAAGTIPKVVIAYTGTVAAGRAAEFYFTVGQKPTREVLQGYYEQASDAFKRLPLPLHGGAKDADSRSNAA